MHLFRICAHLSLLWGNWELYRVAPPLLKGLEGISEDWQRLCHKCRLERGYGCLAHKRGRPWEL